jgi:hypothetical protein
MSNDIMTTETDTIFNDLESVMESNIPATLIDHLNYETPVTVNALAKIAGLSQTALTLQLVELGGKVGVKDGGLVRLPEPEPVSVTKAPVGPRGPTAKVAPRLEACRETLLGLIEAGPVTAIDLLKVAEDRFIYTDILLVARTLLADGSIVETRKGRKATWSAPSEE